MSKDISSSLSAHLAQELTTLAVCLKLVRTDGVEYFFTNHDAEIAFDGDIYDPSDGIVPSSLVSNAQLSVDNMEVIAFLEFDVTAEADFASGAFDNASVDVFLINYEDVSMGVLYLSKGWTIGNVEIHDNSFKAEIRGKAQKLQQTIIEIYTPECRADLGDARCGVDLDDPAFFASGTVTDVSSRQVFKDVGLISSLYEGDVFTGGKLTWGGSGGNADREIEVKLYSNDTGAFELFEAMPFDIEVGDEFEVKFGCDKNIETCKNTFDNVINFRGEPFIPGWDRLLDVTKNL